MHHESQMSVLQPLLLLHTIFFCKHSIFDMTLSQPTISLNFIKYNDHKPQSLLVRFGILMCLVLFIPAVPMAKWRENYSADEIQMTHQRLHHCFNVTFSAFLSLSLNSSSWVLILTDVVFPW